MRVRIAELCESLLMTVVRILLPPEGRHRALPDQPLDGERSSTAGHSPPSLPHPLDVWPFEPDINDLVRPYLLTPEEHHERRLRRRAHGNGMRIAA
ncbi:hypothetical protein [Streptomyces sp. NPDC046862]|uniref:hypothetical protein n=1 Tax=Streptomyces sp. NPDC046862 TaxID=3154603 RepID=UPI0034512684